MKMRLLWLVTIVLLAACAPGINSPDSVPAQNLLPNIVGYERSDAGNLTDALSSLGTAGTLATGNLELTAAIAKIDQMVSCLQSAGAVAANVYVADNANSLGVPQAGVVAVVNQTRLQNSLLACAISSGASAQSVGIEPCIGQGSFNFRGDQITYLYAATVSETCGLFQMHFDALERNQ